MFIHLHLYHLPDVEKEVTRVTVLEDGRDVGHPGSKTLVLGVRPNFEAFPIRDVRWFWVEES